MVPRPGLGYWVLCMNTYLCQGNQIIWQKHNKISIKQGNDMFYGYKYTDDYAEMNINMTILTWVYRWLHWNEYTYDYNQMNIHMPTLILI